MKNKLAFSLILGVMLLASLGAVSATWVKTYSTDTYTPSYEEDEFTIGDTVYAKGLNWSTEKRLVFYDSEDDEIKSCLSTTSYDTYCNWDSNAVGSFYVELQEKYCYGWGCTPSWHTEATATFTVSEPEPYCGDGNVNQVSEECDDGNTENGDGCSSICTIEPCTVTLSKPDQSWYNTAFDIEWEYSASCDIQPDQDVNFDYVVDEDEIFHFGDTETRSVNWLPTMEGLGFKICIDTELHGTSAEVEGCSQTFNVDFTAPTIIANDETCDEGETITLTASATDSLSGVDSSSWKWDLNGDSVYEESGNSVSYNCEDGLSVETVSVKVSDNVGNEAEEEVSITVNNVAPTVTNIGTSGALYEGSSITLSAISSDPSSIFGDGDIPMIYSWDTDSDSVFDDSNVLTCVEDGSIEVSVKATDEDGATGNAYTKIITCENVAPEVDSLEVNPDSIYEEDITTLTATVSDPGADDTTLDYEINWGDGSATTTGSTSDGTITETHQYMDDDAEDSYTITLTVTDTDSATGSDSVEIAVLNKNPWDVDAGEDVNSVKGEEVCFLGSATDVAADIPLTYSWAVDGNPITGNCYIFPDKGVYLVTMTASDKDGGSATDSLMVNVYDYSIHLNPGWNLISIPLVPEDTSIDFVFSTILDKVAYEGDNVATVLQYDAVSDKWHKARPESDYSGFNWASGNRLEDVIPGYGYWINMDEETTLYLNGADFEVESIPEPSVGVASHTWNLVGKYGVTHNSLNPSEAFESLEEYVFEDSLKGYNGVNLVYTNSLETGKGYWIRTKIFPESAQGVLSYGPVSSNSQ